ncbi:hypothetical protein K6025_03410 [Ehrlichia sp. JZT12]
MERKKEIEKEKAEFAKVTNALNRKKNKLEEIEKTILNLIPNSRAVSEQQ